MTAPIGGAFSLTDHHGRAVTDRSFVGRPALLYFGFTHCRVVCPRALARLTAALELSGAAPGDLQPVFVSVDPERDTPAVLKAWLETHYPRFLGLTGPRAAIDAIRSAYKVFASRKADPDDSDGYAMAHTAFSFLLDADGHYAAHFTDTTDERQVAATIRAVIDRQVTPAGTAPPSRRTRRRFRRAGPPR